MNNEMLTLVSPVVIPESIIVQDEGELPRGLYYYAITSVGYKESVPDHILQVYAPHKGNSIILSWKSAEGVSEYRVYRGTILGQYDGYFTIYSVRNCCYIADNGTGELNLNICQ